MTGFSFQTLGGFQQADLSDGSSNDSPIVVVAPAIGIEARYYAGLCAGLTETGIGAVSIDMPGHGASPIRAGRHNDWGYEGLVDHFASVVRALAEVKPRAPIYLLGHSLGGHVALMLAGRGDVRVRGVVLVAAGAPYWRAWRGAGALFLRWGSALYGVLARIIGYFPGHRLGFGDREARTLIVQWAASARTGEYDFPGFMGEELLGKQGPPVHSIGLRGDFFAPEVAIRHMLDKLGQRDVGIETWESPPHGGNHNRWPSEPGFVVDRVVAFIEDTV